MKLPLGARLGLFSNEDDHKLFARVMRNDRFGGAIQKNLHWRKPPPFPDLWHKQQQWDSAVKEPAPPGGSEAQSPHLALTQRLQEQPSALAPSLPCVFFVCFRAQRELFLFSSWSELVMVSFTRLSLY